MRCAARERGNDTIGIQVEMCEYTEMPIRWPAMHGLESTD